MRSARKGYLDKLVLTRFRMFTLACAGMATLGMYLLIEGHIHLIYACLAFCGGILLGSLVGRTNNIVWQEEDKKVYAKFDVIGVIIMASYILFIFVRRKFLGIWLQGDELSGFILFLCSGVMLGRLLTLRKMVLKVLTKQGL